MNNVYASKGIYYGWFIVVTSSFAALVTVGARNGFGVFVLPMSDDFGWSRSTISVAASLGYLVNGLTQPFMGRLYDKIGGRILMLLGLTVLGLSNILLAFTNHIIFLVIIFGLVMSVAMSAGSMNIAVSMITKWFQEKRATAVAIAAAGAPLGALILVPMASYVISFAGWRVAWVVLGSIILSAVPLVYIIIRDKPTDARYHVATSRGDPVRDIEAYPDETDSTVGVDSWKAALRSFPMWQLSGGYFVCGFTTAIISAHFVPFAIEEGFSPATAATAFGVMSGLNVIGVMMAGALGDRFGRKNLLGLVYALRGCAYAVLLMAPGVWGLWIFASVAGLSWIATVPLTTSLTADVYGLRNIGVLSGVIFTAHQIGGAISIQLAGLLRDFTGSYAIPFAIGAALLAVASLLSLSIQEGKYLGRTVAVSDQPASHSV